MVERWFPLIDCRALTAACTLFYPLNNVVDIVDNVDNVDNAYKG